jgi:hypothetical protein
MSIEREPWFEPKRSGLGLTPVTWQGWCATFAFVAVIFATAGVIVGLVHDSLTAVAGILVVTGVELAAFVPFTYRHAGSRDGF